MALEVVEHVEQRRGRRRLVAVHLRPQQHAERTGAGRDHVDRAPFERGADALEDEPVRIRLRDRLQAALDLVVIEERRQRRRHVLGVPDPRELLRRDGRDLRPCAPATDASGATTISAAATSARNMRVIICENEPRWTRCCSRAVATTFEVIAAIVSAALYLVVGVAALARAPQDIRARVFLRPRSRAPRRTR